MDQIISMVGFDASIIKPLAQNYAGQMLESLAKHTKKPLSHGPLSKTEETRIVRGLVDSSFIIVFLVLVMFLITKV